MNVGYPKTTPGILKILEFVSAGIICVLSHILLTGVIQCLLVLKTLATLIDVFSLPPRHENPKRGRVGVFTQVLGRGVPPKPSNPGLQTRNLLQTRKGDLLYHISDSLRCSWPMPCKWSSWSVCEFVHNSPFNRTEICSPSRLAQLFLSQLMIGSILDLVMLRKNWTNHKT